jgi:broad specificity phosphatase PhoE
MLIFVRHGESESNANKTMAGQLDVPLTSEGRKQCRAILDLAFYKFDAIFTSDLQRCLDTADIMIGKRYPRDTWIVAEEFRERSGGLFEGRAYSDLRKELAPREYKKWQRDYFEAPPMGESLKDVEHRVIPFCREHVFPLIQEGGDVIIFTHARVIQVLIGHLKGMDENEAIRLPIENATPYFYRGPV